MYSGCIDKNYEQQTPMAARLTDACPPDDIDQLLYLKNASLPQVTFYSSESVKIGHLILSSATEFLTFELSSDSIDLCYRVCRQFLLHKS